MVPVFMLEISVQFRNQLANYKEKLRANRKE